MKMVSIWDYKKCPNHHKVFHEETGKELFVIMGYSPYPEFHEKILKQFSDFEIKEYKYQGTNYYIVIGDDV